MHKQRTFDYFILIITLALVCVGIVFVYSASFYEQQLVSKSPTYYLNKQIQGAAIGLAALLICVFIPKKWLNNIWLPSIAVGISIVLLFLTALFGEEYNGAKRWLDLGFVQIQPSEIARFSIVYFVAYWLNRYDISSSDPKEFPRAIIVPMAVIIAIVGLVAWGKNLSMIVTMMILVLVVFIAAGIKLRVALLGTGLATALGVILIRTESYRLARFDSFWNPFVNKSGVGYQVVQGLYAIGSGGLFGVGVGNSMQKTAYLPEIESDFILALIAEEVGFVGVIILLALFWLLIWRGFMTAIRSTDTFDYLLALGMTALIGVQLLVNVAVVGAAMPPTGVPLPFISAGNSSLVVFMAAIGLILNVSRRKGEA